MDFEKIYADFEFAKKTDDFVRMSDIIAQVTKYYIELATSGRAIEIPKRAFYITEHTNILIYRVTELLNAGDAVKAQNYLLALAKNNLPNFNEYFCRFYLLARALYIAGDFLNAEKIFARYEKIRAEKWQDLDELSIFYRANCLALTGDFNAAIQLYEQVLTIKADFPEAERNFELSKRHSTENFALEVKSLWYFTNWRDVPIFINARDRLGVMKKLIDWLLEAGYRKIFVLDNDSTYPPLLEYYSALERDWRVKIVRFRQNLGYKSLWKSNILEKMKISTPYVYTDPDVLPIEDCPPDFVKNLMILLDSNRELRKIGLGLVWEDVTFFDKDYIQRTWKNLYDCTYVGDEIYCAQVDTTFALYSNVRHYNLRLSLRTGGDLRAYHLPWYFDYDNLPEDERYYLEHVDNSVTTVKNFRRQINGFD